MGILWGFGIFADLVLWFSLVWLLILRPGRRKKVILRQTVVSGWRLQMVDRAATADPSLGVMLHIWLFSTQLTVFFAPVFVQSKIFTLKSWDMFSLVEFSLVSWSLIKSGVLYQREKWGSFRGGWEEEDWQNSNIWNDVNCPTFESEETQPGIRVNFDIFLYLLWRTKAVLTQHNNLLLVWRPSN